MKRKDLILDATAMGNALALSGSAVTGAMQNGRCSQWFAKLWAAKHCDTRPHKNTNNKDFNSWWHGDGPRQPANVITLTSSGVTIVRSGNKGKKRSDPDEQYDAFDRLLELVSMWVVADVTRFPHVTLLMISRKEMQRFAHRGLISESGISRASFYRMLQ